MNARGAVFVAVLVGCAAAFGCNAKPPTQASNCSGDDCASNESSSSSSSSGDSSSSSASSDSSSSSGSDSSASSGDKVPYDKEATEAALNRAARQVKSNCGKATEDDGKLAGPWGTAKLSVTLGHHGHVRDVKVPDPYDGKAVGKCAALAFSRATFPPWPGSDVTVDWDVEIVDPKSGK